MRSLKYLLIYMCVTLACAGCGKEACPHAYIVAVDVSASIEPEARLQAFEAVAQLARIMKRGDRLVIIPIAGDAARAQGQILRLELPKERQAYDEDLRKFGHQTKNLLQDAEKAAAANPSGQTDILGHMKIAEQEIALSRRYTPMLVILSDFIQDDKALNFNVLRNMATPAQGEEFGKRMAKSSAVRLPGVPVYLGWLRSRDGIKLTASRRQGVENFWLAFFEQASAHPMSVTDGPGLLVPFVKERGLPEKTGTFSLKF